MSTFGRLLRVTTYGESHGLSVGCIVEGFPPGFEVTKEYIQEHLTRRKPGQSSITTSRSEDDIVEIHSGIQNGLTLGTPICLQVKNLDTRPGDYGFRTIPRPGHADFTYKEKYGVNSDSGGGRASARETAARVAAGSLCLKYIESNWVQVIAWVHQVQDISLGEIKEYTRNEIETLGRVEFGNEILNTRCPNYEISEKICQKILLARSQGDSLGGIIACCMTFINDEFFEYMQNQVLSWVGYALMSIPSVKGFKVLKRDGLSIVIMLAFKPVSTIRMTQVTCDWNGEVSSLECRGRHDACVLPRAVPIVETMAAIALMDCLLVYKSLRR